MLERKTSFPCLICGGELYREIEDFEPQPRDGVMCRTTGNYGSTVFDALDGEVICFSICDSCFVQAGASGRLMVTRGSVPVETDLGIVGWKQVERPFVPWHVGLPPSPDEREFLEPQEIVSRWDDRQYRWNLKQEYIIGDRNDQD